MVKKDIKSYISNSFSNPNIVICKTEKEFDEISKLLGNDLGKFKYKEFPKYNCIRLTNKEGLSNSDVYYQDCKDIIFHNASEFLEEEQPTNSLKINELIEGKLYIALHNDKQDRYMFRCKGNNKEIPYLITVRKGYSCEYSMRGDLVTYFTEGYVEPTVDEVTWFLACEKAGKYIPKEQALKEVEKPKFESGKWYTHPNYPLKGSISKYVKIESVRKSTGYYNFIFSDFIDKNGNYTNKNDYSFTSQANSDWEKYMIEVPLSEIQQYLPPNHPDKIVEKPKKLSKEELLEEAKRRYKIGDVVDQTTAYGGKGDKYKINNLEINYDDKSSYVNISVGGIGVYSSNYKIWAEIISTPQSKTEVMEEFKIGDWLYYLGKDFGGSDTEYWKKGVIGQVSRITLDAYELSNIPNVTKMTCGSNFKKAFRKCTPEEIPTISNSSELSSLPEKWCIKRDKENCKVVSKWFNETLGTSYYYSIDATATPWLYYRKSSTNDSRAEKPDGFTEISFEQFKLWVLKESPKQSIDNQLIDKMNDEIPEYVEFIKEGGNDSTKSNGKTLSSSDVGKILKVIRVEPCTNPSEFIKETYICEGGYCLYTTYCKKSSKFEYDQQQLYLVQTGKLTMSNYIAGMDKTESKVVEEEKWKVGGFVRVLCNGNYCGQYKKGEIWKIKSILTSNYYLELESDFSDKNPKVFNGEPGCCHTEVEWLGMTNPEESKTTEKWIPREGDRINIPRSKQGDLWYKNNVKELDDYNYDYFIIDLVDSNTNIGLKRADNGNFSANSFCLTDLSPYSLIDSYSNVGWQDGGTLGKYIVAIDPIKQSKSIDKDLLTVKEDGLIDTRVKEDQSIKTELYQSEEVVYF